VRKVLLIAAIAAAASLSHAADATPGVPLSAPACTPGTSDTTCAPHPLDANGDGTISPAELAAFSASSASAPDLTPLRPPQHTGLDFKDAATEPSPAAPPADHNQPPPLILALLALAALVVLLRRRPT